MADNSTPATKLIEYNDDILRLLPTVRPIVFTRLRFRCWPAVSPQLKGTIAMAE
ncbi:polyprotein [Sesbania bispinosa]|nr:polyprotein [Sesbania bispinosa]